MEKRETKGRSVEQLAGIGSWEWDIINDTWIVSDNWVKIHGCRTSQLNSSQLFSIAHPEDRPAIEDAFHKALKDGIPYDIHHRIIRQDTGEIRYVYAKGVVEFNDSGKPKSLIGAVQDITDRKLTELALQKSEEILNETQKLTKVGGWEWDVMKQTMTWTDEVYRIHDFSFEEKKLNVQELISRSINCYHFDHREKIAEAFKRCVEDGEPYDLEMPFTSAKGRKLWVRTIGRAVKEKNKVVRVVGNIMDITDRKLADEKLIQAHETYLGIINSVKESIYILDKNGVLLEVNQAAITSHGLKREDLIGKNLEVLSADEKNNLPLVAEMIAKAFQGEPQRFEFWGRRIDGTEFPDEVTLTKGVFFGEKVVIALARDITDRKKTEKALQERDEMMRNSQSVAHICSYSTNLNEKEIEKSFWVCSPEFYKIFGIDETYPHTIEGWGRFIHPDYRKELMAYHESVIKERKSFDHEYKIIRINDGAERWVQGTGELVYDEQGKPVRMHGAIQDITERKKAEQDLRESEIRFKTLHNASFGGIIIHDKGLILDCNLGLTEITGYTHEELIGMDGLLLIVESSREKVMQHIQTGYEKPYEALGLRKDGSQYSLRLEARNIPYKGRNVRVAEFRDITEQKRAEQALLEKEERYRKLYEETPVMLHSIDREGRILSVSNMWLQKLGYTKEEVIGRKSTDFLTNESKKQAEELNLPDFFKKGWAKDVSYQMITKDGEIIDVLMAVVAEKNEQNEFIRSMAVIEDVTERIKASQALRESEERFRSLFENASIGIYRSSPHGKILMANPTLVKMLGYNSFEELGKSNFIPDGFDPSYEGNTFQQQIEQKGEVHAIESVWKTKDGTSIFVSESARAFKDEKGVIMYYQGTVEDITYRKQAEEVQKELEIANNTARFKQNFLANMSHEIRTPLTGVMGMIEILEQTPLSHKQRDYLDTIKTSGENLREIIDQVLDFSKIEAGKVSIYTRVFEFSSLTHNAEALYKNNVKAGIKILNVIDPDIPAWIEADKARLAQVLNNLMSNAVKFTTRGVITIHSSLLSCDSENGKVIIKVEVTDTGIGIPEDLQRKLFVPFSQVEARDNRNFEGTGLGLSICKQLVEMMGGEIGVNSEYGKGSKFWFTFPAKTAQIPQLIVQEKVASVSQKRLHILFAEDKVINQKVVKIMLTSMGHEVCIARNGQEAIDLYRPGQFDIILMDIQMPVMDGVTATKKLKEEHKSLPPIVGLSANAFEGDREKYMALGMDDYLTKPVKKADFEQLVARILHPS